MDPLISQKNETMSHFPFIFIHDFDWTVELRACLGRTQTLTGHTHINLYRCAFTAKLTLNLNNLYMGYQACLAFLSCSFPKTWDCPILRISCPLNFITRVHTWYVPHIWHIK